MSSGLDLLDEVNRVGNLHIFLEYRFYTSISGPVMPPGVFCRPSGPFYVGACLARRLRASRITT